MNSKAARQIRARHLVRIYFKAFPYSKVSILQSDCKLCLQVGSSELAVWGHHDCWAIAKSQDQRRLYTVLEQHNKEGLTDACKAVNKFAQLHFEGLFD